MSDTWQESSVILSDGTVCDDAWRYQQLKIRCARACYAYYVLNETRMPDTEYDVCFANLAVYETRYLKLDRTGSPTQCVGCDQAVTDLALQYGERLHDVNLTPDVV